MSFLAGTNDLASPKKKGVIDDPNLNSTNQSAHPAPYVAGWQRLAVTWIDQPRNTRTVAQEQSKGGATTGYKYYADLVALVCLGPIDAITHVILDDDVHWSGNVTRGDEQYVTISLGGKGNMLLFWGTADQDFYGPLQAAGHPAYRNQAYIYLPQFSFGLGRTDAPNMELGVQRVLSIPWLPGLPNNSNDANPVVVLADLLTNPLYGLGMDSALIDQAQWLATAQQLAGEDAVCSPLITDSTGVRQLITQVCEYFYGYLRWTPQNLLQIGLIRDSPTDLTGLLELTASHLTEVPEITTSEWSSTFNRTIVTYLEQTRYWQDDYRSWMDDGNYQITGQTLLQVLDRKWITRNTVAQNLAQRYGKQTALPQFTGTLQCRRSVVAGCAVGDWIVLNYDSAFFDFAFVLQITGIQDQGDQKEEIELDVAGQQITTDPRELYDRDDVINAIPGTLDVQALAMWRVWELPKALAPNATKPVCAALAVRGGTETVGFNVLDSQDDATFDVARTVDEFAWGGVLTQDYPGNTTIDDVTVGLFLELQGPDLTLPGQNALAAANNKLLVFAGNEIMAVQQIVVVNATRVHLFVQRGRYDTSPVDHPVGSQAFLIRKRKIRRIRQDDFAADDSVWFKCQSFSVGEQYDLSLVAEQQITIVGRAQMPQPFTNLIVNGQSHDPATFPAGHNIPLSWTLTTNELFGSEVADEDYFTQSGITTSIDIWDTPAAVNRMGHIIVAPGINTYTIANSDLVGYFGGSEPASFYIRLWSKKAGVRSFSYVDFTVNRN